MAPCYFNSSALIHLILLSMTMALPQAMEKLNSSNPPSVYRHTDDEGIMNFEFQWDPKTEPWLHFQVRVCGGFCNGNEYVKLMGEIWPLCATACFPCDCDVTCSIYGTCCPQIDPKTPLKSEGRIQEYRSHRYRPVNFHGDLSDYNFIDRNDFKQFARENPALEIDLILNGRFKCLTTSWKHSDTWRYYAITDCPDEVKNKTLRNLCETTDLNAMTLDLATPILDKRNGIVFKNRFCLQCNNYNESEFNIDHQPETLTTRTTPDVEAMLSSSPYQNWNIGIKCNHYQKFYTLDSADAFLRAVNKDVIENRRSPCDLGYQPPPSEFPSRHCDIQESEWSPMGEVHPTGQCVLETGVYKQIWSLCREVTSEAYRLFERQNAFCYMCMSDFPSCYSRSISHQLPVTSYLSFLLGERSALRSLDSTFDEVGDNVFLCNDPLEWMDEEDKCRQPECSSGKRLNDGTCKSIVNVISTLGYKVAIILTPSQEIHENHISQLIDSLSVDVFAAIRTLGQLHINIVVFGDKESDSYNFIKYVTIYGHLVSDSQKPRDEFENSFLKYHYQIQLNSEPAVSIINEPGDISRDDSRDISRDIPRESPISRNILEDYVTVNLSAIYTGADMTNFLRFPFGNDQHTRALYGGLPSRKPIPRNNRKVKNTTRRGDSVIKYINYEFRETVHKNMPMTSRPGGWDYLDSRPESIWEMKKSFIDLTHSLVCPYVSFDILEISSVPEQGEIQLQFSYREKTYTIDVASATFRDSVSVVGVKVSICIDTFREKFQKTKDYLEGPPFTISVTEKAKRYFALVCFLLSAVCLCLTIATYALFPQLRTLPGLNTLMLSITLVIAHIFLVVVVETVGYIDGWPCMGLAMGLHYSWLVACQWMGVCCFHMFSVFRGTNTHSTPSRVKDKFEWYSFYAFGSSAVIVALTIILSEIISGSKSTGYSPDFCIFDSEWSYLVPLFSFVLPVGLISWSNLVMFALTVREIMAVTRLQESGRLKGRDGVVTYVKLSSLTGLFWLLTILAARLNNVILEFISIPFMALQGVFIFFSFTFNANTRKLYSQMLGKSDELSTTTTSAATRVSLVNDGDEDGKTSAAHV